MKKLIFVDVDTLNDFILDKGKLTAKAEAVIPVFGQLMDFTLENGNLISSSQDTHTPDDQEFNHFPPHCIKGKRGYDEAEVAVSPNALKIERKNEDKDWDSEITKCGQLIFEKNNLDIFTNPNFEKIAQDSETERYIVYGIAIEYCVKIVVMGLLKRGKKAVVHLDAIKAINDDTGRAALDEIVKTGAELSVLEDIIGNK